MVRPDDLRVLVVAASGGAAVAAALTRRPDMEAAATSPAAAPETLASLRRRDGRSRVDCVVDVDASLDVRGVEAVQDCGVPVVVYTDERVGVVESRDWVAGYVRRTAGGSKPGFDRAPPATPASVAHLADEVRWATKHETRLQLRQRRRRIARLHDGTARLAGVRTPGELYDRTVEVAAEVFDFDACLVSIHEDGRLVRQTHVGPPFGADALDISEGLAGETFRTGEALLVTDVADSPALVAADTDIGSVLSAPIGDVGVFQAVSTDLAAFGAVDLELAELLLSHVAETVERLRAEADLRERRERVTRLHDGTAALVATRSLPELYERTVEVAERVLRFETCYLYVAEPDRFVPVAASSGSRAVSVDPVPADHGLVARTLRTGESYLVDDVEAEPAADPVAGEYGSGISVPVADVGVFQAVSRDGESFTPADRELAELLVSYVAATHQRIAAEDDLRGERDRLDALFEHVPDPAVTYEFVDGAPVARRVNSAFERTFGFGADDVLGEDVDAYLVPDDEREAAATFNDRLRAGETVRAEVTRRTADGPRPFLVHVVPIQLDTENAAGYAIYTDLSEQKARERELRRQNARLDEFAGVVSHDLRNPLNVAQGRLELAAETGDDDHLDRAAAALDRIEALVTDLLTLARDGQVVGDTAPVDLGSLARDAWTTVETADATLDVAPVPPLAADDDRVWDLLANLFRNAVAHGGSTVAVRVGALDDGGFFVADDGPGIPAEERERAFEAGYTTADDGTGFGLAIVRRVADAHDWDVRVVEGRDGGARFEFGTG